MIRFWRLCLEKYTCGVGNRYTYSDKFEQNLCLTFNSIESLFNWLLRLANQLMHLILLTLMIWHSFNMVIFGLHY